MMTTEIPRRARIDLMTPAELAIREAIIAVESLPADPRLTNAVTLLDKAQRHVADFVDGAPTALERSCLACGGFDKIIAVYDAPSGVFVCTDCVRR